MPAPLFSGFYQLFRDLLIIVKKTGDEYMPYYQSRYNLGYIYCWNSFSRLLLMSILAVFLFLGSVFSQGGCHTQPNVHAANDVALRMQEGLVPFQPAPSCAS
jgi:hypothetical protein